MCMCVCVLVLLCFIYWFHFLSYGKIFIRYRKIWQHFLPFLSLCWLFTLLYRLSFIYFWGYLLIVGLNSRGNGILIKKFFLYLYPIGNCLYFIIKVSTFQVLHFRITMRSLSHIEPWNWFLCLLIDILDLRGETFIAILLHQYNI